MFGIKEDICTTSFNLNLKYMQNMYPTENNLDGQYALHSTDEGSDFLKTDKLSS